MKFDFFRENKKNIITLAVGLLMVLVLQIVSGYGDSNDFVKNRKGEIVGIVWDQSGKTASHQLVVSAEKGKLKIKKDVIISFDDSDKQKADLSLNQETEEQKVNREINNVIDGIEETQSGRAMLPSTVGDGVKLRWSTSKNYDFLYIMLIFLLVILAMYFNWRDKDKRIEKKRKYIIRQFLPCFINQLLLLLNSGLIFVDAFEKICQGYRQREPDKSNYFIRLIVEIDDEAKNQNKNPIVILNNYGKKSNVKEFARVTSIILDSQYKGINLSGKLEIEGEILWQNRKKLAEEKGKLAETKLTFPLAVLLLVLIVITAAPAIMQI
ncbi:MAG: hypothetical protein RR769_02025 [Anaerovoracaceae bacterium]